MAQRPGTAYHRAVHAPVPVTVSVGSVALDIEWSLARQSTVRASIAALDRRISAGGYRSEDERQDDMARRRRLWAMLPRAPL